MRRKWNTGARTVQTPRRGAAHGFTLIEMLVVLGIIALLASVVIGASVWLRRGAAQKNVRMLIERVQTALELYRNTFGQFPNAIATYEEWSTLPLRREASNVAVAQVLLRSDAVGSAGSGGPPEISYRTFQGSSAPHIIDHWGSDLNIIKGGHNSPGLDIWSSGENGRPEYNPNDPNDCGDDIVNWRGS